jgi:hypothetical protein
MSESSEKKKRGGPRSGAGRKKQAPPVALALDGRANADRSIAGRVLNQAKSEKLWLGLIDLERKRLGIDENGKLVAVKKDGDNVIDGPDYQGKFSIIPLTNLLRYLEDRHYGRPVDTVNHMHDKPLEMNVNVTLRERFKLAMEKAEERVRKLG